MSSEMERDTRVFISYRRSGGEFLAQLLYDRLKSRGYDVFLDVESLRTGKFNEQLLRFIEQCDFFLLVLPPNALERCVDESDWLRIEITHALKCDKTIIPIMLRGFEGFPADLPDDISEVRNYQGIHAGDSEVFPHVIDRLCSYMGSKSQDVKNAPKAEVQANRVMDALGWYTLVMIALPLVIRDWYTSPDWMPSVIDMILSFFGEANLWLYYPSLLIVVRMYTVFLNNNQEYCEDCGRMGLLTCDDMNSSPEQLLSKLALLEPSLFVSEHENHSIEGYAFGRRFKDIQIGSVTGETVDYFLISDYFHCRVVNLYYMNYLTMKSTSIRFLVRQGFHLTDGSDKHVCVFTDGEWWIRIAYSSFGLGIIGIEMMRDSATSCSQLLASTEAQYRNTIEYNLALCKNDFSRMVDEVRSDFRSSIDDSRADKSTSRQNSQHPADVDDDRSECPDTLD